ncbi:hypothetical protein J19TS2_15010 [Cohnella xylanilytica]|nr:hypothetical protein J19TS2_15010 [Cohnella xylanilytica]
MLLTRPPLTFAGASSLEDPLDLHVLGTPPAFVLSQDQTLHKGETLSESLEGSIHCWYCTITLDVQFSRNKFVALASLSLPFSGDLNNISR